MKLSDMFSDHHRVMVDVVALETSGSVERQWAYAREVVEAPRPFTFEEVASVRQAAMDKIAEIIASAPETEPGEGETYFGTPVDMLGHPMDEDCACGPVQHARTPHAD